MLSQRLLAPAVVTAIVVIATCAHAQLAISANDNKVMLVNGTVQVVQNPAPDTVTIIDLKASPPKMIAEIEAPASVVGPPERDDRRCEVRPEPRRHRA